MHDDQTFQNLADSLDALKQLVLSQAVYIRTIERERDFLRTGHQFTAKQCECSVGTAKSQER